MKTKNLLQGLAKLGVLIAVLFTTHLVFADKGITKVAGSVTDAFSSIAQLLLAIAYVAGIGFAVASIFKFKQHKDNPTQIPIGTPIALLAIAVALIFLGYLITPLGETLTGDAESTAGAKGTGGSVPGLSDDTDGSKETTTITPT